MIYENPLTGQIRYPGRADVPMPERYAEQGYIRTEFQSAHALGQFEKTHNVANEALNYNTGNSPEETLQSSPDMAGMPVTPTGSDALTVNGVSISLRSRDGR